MTLWKLELLRLWRTRRVIALCAVFLILGFGSPVLTYFLPDLVKDAGSGVQIILPEQTAADGFATFASNIAQLGTLVVVIVAAATLAIDAQPGLAVFYRTRLRRATRLVLPRYLVITLASIGGLALGTLGAWYETVILLGSVSFPDLVAGFFTASLWLCFVTAVVTLFASLIRSVLGVAGVSIGTMFALSLLGSFSFLRNWVPTRLSGSSADFILGTTSGLWQASAVTAIAAILAMTVALYRLDRREH
jgi:ABC-2 type transport system permease protein